MAIVELAVRRGSDVCNELQRSIQGALRKAKKRLEEGEEHGGSRARLCLIEAQAAVAKARHLGDILRRIKERRGEL